jgi:hypothetical protein
MTKRLAVAFALGATLPLVTALYAGGENLAQAGFRLAAIEQGFALAARHWQFEATPAQATTLAQWSDATPVAPIAARKPKPARRP